MTALDAFVAGKAARCNVALDGTYAGKVQMHLSRARWLLRAKGWPADDRVSAVLITSFGAGWEAGAGGGEVVEA
jgi:hypothetical protein